MALLEAIEKHRFLGREFLIWLWFESEQFEAEFEIPRYVFKLWFEGQITLEVNKEERECSKLSGVAPSATSEAREALRQGKYPTQARLHLEHDERQYTFMLAAETLGISGVKLPALIKEEEEERFFERMYLIEELETMIEGLFAQFLALKLSASWSTHILPAIQGWIRDEPLLDTASYLEARHQAEPLRSGITVEWAKPQAVTSAAA
jgi:hypothetical protein